MPRRKTNEPVGRPLKFKTQKDLQKAIDQYFAKCDNAKISILKYEKVIEIPNPQPYTTTGLALAIGVDRKTLLNYGRKEQFFHTVRTAKQKVEECAERHLFVPGIASGVQFNLKNNHGWKDETTVIDEKKVSLEDSKGKKMSLEQLQEHFKNLFAQKNAKDKAR